MTDEISFRYSEVVDKGFRPWLGNEPGPPPHFEWGLPVLLRDGTETLERGGRYTDWISTGRPNDIVGYKRKDKPMSDTRRRELGVLPPPISASFPIDWDDDKDDDEGLLPAIPVIIGAISGAALMALATWLL